MRTEILRVDPNDPAPALIERAAKVLLDGGLVAFPTETVYGLGALADNADAIAKIYQAKGRPSHNPLIAHVPDALAAKRCASEWPAIADTLAERFWPGPLTLVVQRNPALPPSLSAGGNTVALRAPKHPVALALLRAVDHPIAAPSANRSSQISPTRAEHVLKSLDGRIELLLDAGPCSVGIESTVVDLTCNPPEILRPGGLSLETLRTVVPTLRFRSAQTTSEIAHSPGLDPLHYAPTTPLQLVSREKLLLLTSQHTEKLSLITLPPALGLEGVFERCLPRSPESYAAQLYDALHELDDEGTALMLAELPPEEPGWEAVHDRLRRASAPRKP